MHLYKHTQFLHCKSHSGEKKMFLNTRYAYDLFLGYILYFTEHGIFLQCPGDYVEVVGSVFPWMNQLFEVTEFIYGWSYRKAMEIKLAFPITVISQL